MGRIVEPEDTGGEMSIDVQLDIFSAKIYFLNDKDFDVLERVNARIKRDIEFIYNGEGRVFSRHEFLVRLGFIEPPAPRVLEVKTDTNHPIKVKIIEASSPLAWYADSIGKEFDVYIRGSGYVLKDDYDAGDDVPWRLIEFLDAIEVKQ